MKKAGIITFHFADNFGAVLQAYALSKTIEKLGVNVEIIDFVPQSIRAPYNLFINIKDIMFKTSFIIAIKIFLGRIYHLKKNYFRIKNFNSFRKQYFKLSNRKYKEFVDLVKQSPKYDYYITGSDQVWNPNLYLKTGGAYFLDFVDDGSKKISYAASIAEHVEQKHYDDFKIYLKKFDYISVREKSAQKFVQKFTDKSVNVTLDPTFLIDKQEWMKIATFNNVIKDKYILVFDIVKNNIIISIANKIAKEYGYKIISYSNKKGYDNWHSSFSSSNPTDFIGLYANAEFVVTSSFHGTVFAIIFNKPFYTIPHPTRASRMVDLLNELKLSNRLISEIDDLEIINDIINYDEINKTLLDLRNDSIDFIKEALDIGE